MSGNQDNTEEFVCNLFTCHWTFKNKEMLDKHIWYHVGERPFMCQICGIAYKLETTLFSHLELKHYIERRERTKTIRGYSSCNICQALIPLREKRAHVLTHIPSFDLEQEGELEF